MIDDFFRKISSELPVKPGDLSTYSPLALAYVGDAVFDLYIRTLILSRAMRQYTSCTNSR